MKVTFFGTRGSVPVADPEFARFGGNTSCVMLTFESGRVAFLDAGNTFGDPWGNGYFDPLDLRWGYGFGVRWFSPIGPLRFEWGFPINRQPDERPAVFDFTIGSAF